MMSDCSSIRMQSTSCCFTSVSDIPSSVAAAHSPPCKGGVAAPSKNGPVPKRRGRGGQFGEIFRPTRFAELLLRLRPIGLALRATPSAAFGGFATFAKCRSHPSFARRGMGLPIIHSQLLKPAPTLFFPLSPKRRSARRLRLQQRHGSSDPRESETRDRRSRRSR